MSEALNKLLATQPKILRLSLLAWAERAEEMLKAQAAEIESLRAERDALSKQVFALTGEVENKADYARCMYSMHQDVSAERDALKADAERLNWLERKLFGNSWNGVIGSGSQRVWRILPGHQHTTVRMVGNTFRAAIDAAKEQQ